MACILVLVMLGPLAKSAEAQEPETGVTENNQEMNDIKQAPKKDEVNLSPVQVSFGTPSTVGPSQFLRDFLGDEKQLWTAPARIRFADTSWLVPLGGFYAGLLVTDSDVSRHLSHDPKTLSHYSTLSNGGVAALVGGAGGMWLLSHYNHNAHWSETGALAGEAAVHSLVMTEGLKYSLRRERPYQGDGTGPFFQPGGTSFPSEHAAAAWSVASVIAHEYPGPLTKILAYGLAGLVSYSRIRAEKHFPSDVLVGSLIGQLSAYQTYTKHHDVELGGDNWDSWSTQARRLFEEPTRPNMGSPFVPLDSWVYPAMERLMGLGLIDSGFLAHRPWTRAECARLIAEAGDHIDEDSDAEETYDALQQEFGPELEPPLGGLQTQLDSVYTRVTEISGPPLGRGWEAFDFGQTFINDFGRPYAEGTNSVTGFEAYLTGGPWVGYVRGEYQYTPSAPPLTLSERTFITSAPFSFLGSAGVMPATPFPATGQFKLIEAYAGLQFANWQISFGPQTMWSGPTEGGPMLLSNNSEAIPMIRLTRVSPVRVPLLSKILGPAWVEVFLGQISGQHFLASFDNSFALQRLMGTFASPLQNQPYLHGERLSWKPTRNFEFGVSRVVMFGGGDIPLTLGYYKQSLFGFQHDNPGTPSDPGKQTSGLDWNYRLPLMRRWVSFYGDAFTYDQYSPIAYWDRSAISAGLYLSHLPKVPKLDLRVEGVYTDLPTGGAIGQGFWYSGVAYPSGYTNGNNLIGSWIGRDGQGAQAWMNYWFTPKNRVQLFFRHLKVSQQFLPGGGTLTDFGLRGDLWTTPHWGFSAIAQYETWNMPVIQPGQQAVFSTSLQVTFRPKLGGLLHRAN